MKQFEGAVTGASVLALCAISNPALADVTPADVWQNLTEYMDTYGYAVEATESTSGDDLVVSDVVMTFEAPEGEGSFAIAMDRITLADQGDGTVAVSFPPVMPISMTFVEEGAPVNMTVNFTQEVFEMIVSGDPEAIRYDYTAQSMGMTLAEMTVAGEAVPPSVASFDLSMGPVSGMSETRVEGSLEVTEQSGSFGEMRMDFAYTEPGAEDNVTGDATLQAVTFGGSTTLPEGVDMADMAAATASGFSGDATFSHEGSEVSFFVNDGEGKTDGSMSSDSGALAVRFSEQAMIYETRNTGFAIEVLTPEVPFPLSFESTEAGFNMAVPFATESGPQDAALGLRLVGAEFGDMIWGMLDPAAVLPRDPATVVADFTAKVTPFVNLFDPEDMERLEDGEAMPGEVNAVTLNDLTVEAAGLTLNGEGAFTLDNSDTSTFDGFPRPEGEVSMTMSGHNALIDNLVKMGLLAQEDVMGTRMMLSMFTVPGDAEDSARSTITINEQGHIFANGQRIN